MLETIFLGVKIMEENKLMLVQDLIYEIRGHQVMIDEDLARIYQVETKRLMKQSDAI